MIKPQWLELPMSRTNFNWPKDVRAIKVRPITIIYVIHVDLHADLCTVVACLSLNNHYYCPQQNLKMSCRPSRAWTGAVICSIWKSRPSKTCHRERKCHLLDQYPSVLNRHGFPTNSQVFWLKKKVLLLIILFFIEYSRCVLVSNIILSSSKRFNLDL